MFSKIALIIAVIALLGFAYGVYINRDNPPIGNGLQYRQ